MCLHKSGVIRANPPNEQRSFVLIKPFINCSTVVISSGYFVLLLSMATDIQYPTHPSINKQNTHTIGIAIYKTKKAKANVFP